MAVRNAESKRSYYAIALTIIRIVAVRRTSSENGKSNMKQTMIVAVVGLCAILLSACVVSADDSPTVDDVWSSRGLRSGEVIVSVKQKNKDTSAKESYHIAFDFEQGLLRFDCFEGDLHWRFARNKDECILQEENADYLVQYPRDWIDPVEQRHPFDLRLMGIISIGEFEHRSTYDDVETFISKKTKLTEAKQEDDGTTGMQWDFLVDNKYNADVTIWFDKNQGFSPVKMRKECENGRHATIVDSESKTRWKKIKDAWVPSSSTIEQPGFLTIEMTFDWKDVNAPQDETIYRQFPLHQVP